MLRLRSRPAWGKAKDGLRFINIRVMSDNWVTSRTARAECGFIDGFGIIIDTGILGLDSRSILD